jgi:hypothetical protein
MTCNSPKEIDDFLLLTYLDGEAEPEVREHVESCESCRARAKGLQRMEALVAAGLYRRSCPPADELGEYHLGLLGRKRAAEITRHLQQRCPYCRRELALLQSFLGDLAPEPQPGGAEAAQERLRVTVARLVRGARELLRPPQPGFEPVYAGVRGQGGAQTEFEAGNVRVVAGAEQDADALDRVVLLGLTTGAELEGATVRLWQRIDQDTTLVATVPLDEAGNFSASGLERGKYELMLGGSDWEIYIGELTL